MLDNRCIAISANRGPCNTNIAYFLGIAPQMQHCMKISLDLIIQIAGMSGKYC